MRLSSGSSRLILVASMVLTLLLLPSIPGCGCGEDSGNPTDLRGGGECTVCVAFRLLERDLLICQSASVGSEPSAESNGTGVEVMLCPVSANPSLEPVSVTPTCSGPLGIGDVAEFEITVAAPHDPLAEACFDVCECIDGSAGAVLDSFCVLFRDPECLDWEVRGTPRVGTFQQESPLPSRNPTRVVRCDDMADLCCFCVYLDCAPTNGLPDMTPTSQLSDKTVCAEVTANDISLVDKTLGGTPIVKPRCQLVPAEGGLVKVEVCVLDTYTPGSSLTVVFTDGAQQVFGITDVVLDANCEPRLAPYCCVPFSVCFHDEFVVTNIPISAEAGLTNPLPGMRVFPSGAVPISPEGSAITYWVCLPEQHGPGSSTLGIFTNDGSDGSTSVSIELTYGENNCFPEVAIESQFPVVQAPSILCPPIEAVVLGDSDTLNSLPVPEPDPSKANMWVDKDCSDYCCFCLWLRCLLDDVVVDAPDGDITVSKLVTLGVDPSSDPSLDSQVLPGLRPVDLLGTPERFKIWISVDHALGATATYVFIDAPGAEIGRITVRFDATCTPTRADPQGEDPNIFLDPECDGFLLPDD